MPTSMWLRRVWCAALLALAIGLSPAATAQDKTAIVAALPPAAAWVQHFQRDILPFWQTPAALGNPVGNFPTYRCNDGSVVNPQAPCPEFLAAPDWIKSTTGRQYVRMMSRQVYLYGVAFHLTGDEKYLEWARAGAHYIVDHTFDAKTGNIVSYWENGKAVSDPASGSSQDLAYDLIGLSFYYYLTRDPYVLPPIVGAERYIREHYYDGRLGAYRLELKGAGAEHLILVAQLDQANAYMLLLTPLLRPPHQARWRSELAQIAHLMRERFYDAGSGFLIGDFDRKAGVHDCIFKHDDTDFGHTIKAYWMLSFMGRLLDDAGLSAFADEKAPVILQRAFLPGSGSWGTQPTCGTGADNIDRTSTWWMAAELDQAALSFGLRNPGLLAYIPRTYNFWLTYMVDHQHGEVWDELALPAYAPRLPKMHLWKNGFHTAEHALIGYIATQAARSQPVTLYYAFPDCEIPPGVQPYYYNGQMTAHAESPLQNVRGFCRVTATFANVH